jgi:ribosomal protein S18 acetylase RimI-like enzyme
VTLHRLTREQKPEAVSVLISAFHDYPVMCYALKDISGTDYDRRLRAIIEFYCEARFAKDRPVFGIRENDLLVAVTLIDETSLKPWAELESELNRLKAAIGERAYRRLELYEAITGRSEPSEPHYFVGMIGVRPDHHGKGYGRILLNEAKKMSEADPRSIGVCLSTEDKENVKFYQHCGYHIIAEADIANELHSWCMFLPTLS